MADFDKDMVIGQNGRELAFFCPHCKTHIRVIAEPKIVRCKDCKHYECGYGCKLWHTIYNQNDDFFCADGERRTKNV